jgi:hypothetical protein
VIEKRAVARVSRFSRSKDHTRAAAARRKGRHRSPSAAANVPVATPTGWAEARLGRGVAAARAAGDARPVATILESLKAGMIDAEAQVFTCTRTRTPAGAGAGAQVR